ncbi:MAG TPA: flagellar basal-body MS-ring/collar protein FliF [Candidatus Baltobacteraceae bacterium]|nr:flagellar basal-body MS-ring/collar protein FliF [Candidatus Baltobacteraceae bacterium]
MDRLPSSIASFPARFRVWWSAQSAQNRLVAGTVAAALLLGVVFFGAIRMRGPSYAVLFSNLQPDDASAVIAKLDSQKIPHRTSDDGTTIFIPQQNVADERVALAGDGIVHGGGVGYELFDRTNLGMTDFQEKIAKTRATEGELQRTIAGLTPVQSARVHIASPEASLYSSTQQPTTASIAIQTKPGMQLNSAEVRGITQLVAGAVEGLKPENVTIVDQNGTVLRPSALDGTGAGDATASALKLTQDQLIAKEKFESDLQQSLQGLLDQTIGAHRSAVRVASQMNFDANSSETKTYAPAGTVLSEQSERETYNGTGANRNRAIGVPGTTTNVVPTYQGAQNQQSDGRYANTKKTTNYDVGEQTAKHVDAPGKVTRLSVAVLVNVPGAGSNANVPYAVAPADVQKIRNVVAAAAGIDAARGDQISVEAMPFAPSAETLAATRTVTTVLGIPLAPFVAILAILGLAAAGLAFGAMRRGGFRPSGELPTFDSTLAEELPSFEEHPMLDGTPAIAAPIRSAADLTREQMIEYVTSVAQENPENIAKLVKLWLAE